MFKVLQFNMQFGQSWDDAYPDYAPINLNLTIAEIRSQDADIVLLQEVEQVRPLGVQHNPPRNYTRLRKALVGYDGFFLAKQIDPRELPFGIGLAIFSKTPLRNTMSLDLPSPAIEFDFRGKKRTPTDRLLIGAKTAIQKRKLAVFNTHLLAFFMLNPSAEEQTSQRDLVIKQLRKSTGPTLLGGDFNVSKHESLVRQFANAGFKTVQTDEITWRRRPYVLDHIFYNQYLRLVSHAVKPTPASDHHMLIAEFDFVD
ncbi:MAG TPA: endonuclease/exonuclease/phosphatase family protein [Burkholderiales bacterium]|nr:endonuclease/exonuclease/phosphatase family protein [Burkholderiales bacterium]